MAKTVVKNPSFSSYSYIQNSPPLDKQLSAVSFLSFQYASILKTGIRGAFPSGGLSFLNTVSIKVSSETSQGDRGQKQKREGASGGSLGHERGLLSSRCKMWSEIAHFQHIASTKSQARAGGMW
jgi:hypothetical protein